MDNTGAYATYSEMFELMYPSSIVSYKSSITLSGKSGNTFNYSNSSFDLQEGDIVCQGEYAQVINSLSTGPDTLTLDDATDFVDGSAKVYRVAKSLFEIDMLRTMAMQTIDVYTGQWFNKREFLGANALKFEGNNTYVLHFSIPIIEIANIYLNDGTDPYDIESYQVFNSRTMPDDRRNPKIKLWSNTNDIYKHPPTRYWDGIFYKGRIHRVEGSFGFLEPDGSTPAAIKWATARLVMRQAMSDPSQSTVAGRVKKEKTDLHEIEYEGSLAGRNALHGTFTGDDDIDRIFKMYKAPLAIGGTDPLFTTITQLYDVDRLIW